MTISSSKNKKLVVALIGLPARGKSYIAKKLGKFFNWLDIPCQIFNVGNYRRQFEGTYSGNDFFNATNNSAQEIRQLSAAAAMDDMIDWLQNRGGEIAFYDATNTTRERRQWIKTKLKDHDLNLLFLEIVCDDENTINDNIVKVKLLTADYLNFEINDAIKDFKTRISHYESVYEPIDPVYDCDESYIQIVNKGEKYETNKIDSIYKREICKFLQSVRLTNRSIHLLINFPLGLVNNSGIVDSKCIEIAVKNDNEVHIFGNDSVTVIKDSLHHFTELHFFRDNLDIIALQLIPFVIDSENHHNLPLACDERISKILLQYFHDSSKFGFFENLSPAILRIDCNSNEPGYLCNQIL